MTQAMTIPDTGRAAAITATLTAPVELVQVDRARIEARHQVTSELLGTAVCHSHPQADVIGWLVQVGHHYREVVVSTAVAELVLLYLASCEAIRLGAL